MAVVADYVPVWDTGFTLSPGDPIKEVLVGLGADLAPLERGVIAFLVETNGLSEVEVLVNGARRGPPYRLGPNGVRAFWEIMSPGTLFAGSNRIRFALVPPFQGVATISDVVLWYKRSA